jgi:hypothetical protein
MTARPNFVVPPVNRTSECDVLLSKEDSSCHVCVTYFSTWEWC